MSKLEHHKAMKKSIQINAYSIKHKQSSILAHARPRSLNIGVEQEH